METQTKKPKASPTPGPWEYFEQREWGRDRMYGSVRGDGMVIVNGCAPGGTEEQKANCRLIAAAPDLLAVCKALAERGAVIATTGLGEQLRAAIAKARK